MKFIKKKNMQEGEELLYVPEMHWMYVAKHVILAMPFLVLLLVQWRSLAGQADMTPTGLLTFVSALAVRNVLISAVIALMVVLVFRLAAYLYNEYGVTNQRLLMREGSFRLYTGEIPTDRIESIYCYQGLFGKLFRYGTIGIVGVGGSKVPVFKMVRRPFALRRKIVDIIEKNKVINVVHGDLPKAPPPPPPVAKPEPEKEQEPIYRYGTFVRVLNRK